MRKRLFLKAACALMLAVLGLASCSNSNNNPAAPTATPLPVVIQVYAGPLDPGGSATYIVTLANDSTVQVMLAGEQLANPIRTVSIPLQVDISNWDGSTCTALDTNVTAPRLTAQLQRFLTTGSYCVRLSDPGNLTETVGSVVRIAYPAPTQLQGTSSPATFASTLLPGGIASKTFVASTAGTVAITLNSLGVSGPIGLGIGVYGTDVTTSCTLTKIVNVMPGAAPQLVEQVDAGTYCAAVIDTAGTVSRSTTFSMNISNP
jgi:hypothetical protein